MVGKLVEVLCANTTHLFKAGDICKVVEKSGFANDHWCLERLTDKLIQILCKNEFKIIGEL